MSFIPRCAKTVMVCALPRSGSNLLCEALASTRCLGNPDEWLNQDRDIWNRSRFGLPDDATLETLIEALQEQMQTLNGVFSHKILMYSFVQLRERLGNIPENAGLGVRDLMQKYFPELRLVYIRRNDTLGQAVSLMKASQSALWHNNNRKVSRTHPTFFSWTHLQAIRDDLAGQERAWQAFFGEMGLPVMEVCFEELTGDLENTVNRVIEFLDIECKPFERGPKLSHKPTRGAINEEWRKRYLALEKRVESAPETIHAADAVRHAEITVDAEELEAEGGELFTQRITIRNTSGHRWEDYGRRDGSGWIKVASQIIVGEGEVINDPESWRELPGPVEPGASVTLEIIKQAPQTAGTHTVWVDCVVTPDKWFNEVSDCAVKCTLTVTPGEKHRFIERYFGVVENEASDDLYRLDWFGYFHLLQFPKVYHAGLGYITCSGPGVREDRFIFESEIFGVLKTSSREFPVLWSEKEQAYLKWHRGTHRPPRLSIRNGDSWHPYNYHVVDDSLQKAAEFFGTDVPPNGRLELDWFGLVDVSAYPLISHDFMGKVWCSGPGAAEDSYFFYNRRHGWLWTSSESYPHIRRLKEKEWILAEDMATTDF